MTDTLFSSTTAGTGLSPYPLPVITVAAGQVYADQASVIPNPLHDPDGTGIQPFRYLAYVRTGTGPEAAQLALAVSKDGLSWQWTAYGEPGAEVPGPVLPPTGALRVNSPHALFVDGVFYLWNSVYEEPGRGIYICTATSRDGVQFESNERALVPDGSGFDAYSVQAPSVLHDAEAGGFRMWYVGRDSAKGTFRIGVAESSDGRTWTPRDEPVFQSTQTWSSGGIGFPRVVREADGYVMYYSGKATLDAPWHIGRATSPDGLVWTPEAAKPILSPGAADSFDAAGVYSPSVLQDGDRFFLFYGAAATGGGTFQTGVALPE